MSTPAIQTPAQQSWFRRHRALIVGLGILGLLLVMFAGSILLFVRGLMFKAEPTRVAIARAQANQQVLQRLGAKVREGWLITGNIQLDNDTGHADLEIPIAGPRGEAEIHAVADKEFGRWQYREMRVGSPNTEETIDLIGNPGK